MQAQRRGEISQMMQEQPVNRFYTINEVAEIARVSNMTIYRLVHSGQLPAIRVGKSFRIPHAALTQYLTSSYYQPDTDQQGSRRSS